MEYNYFLMQRVFSSDFKKLVSSNFITKIGNGVHEFVFIILVLNVTDSDALFAGVIYFVRFLPYLIVGPYAGVLSDACNKNMVMIVSDVIRAIITLVFAILVFTNHVNAVALAIYGMLMLAFRAIYAPAFSSSIRFLVNKNELVKANSVNQLASEIGLVIGPALGAIATYQFGNYGLVLIIDCITFVASSIILMFIREPSISSKSSKDLLRKSFVSVYLDFYQAKGISNSTSIKISVLFSGVCIMFVGGAIGILVPKYILHTFRSEELIGITMSLISAGAMIGSIVCTRINLKTSVSRLMVFWAIYGAVFVFALEMHHSTFLLYAWAIILGISGAFVDITIPTLIQKKSAPDNLGTNFSYFSTIANTGEALSGPLVGLIAVFLSTSSSLVLIGILVISTATIGYRMSGSKYIRQIGKSRRS